MFVNSERKKGMCSVIINFISFIIKASLLLEVQVCW